MRKTPPKDIVTPEEIYKELAEKLKEQAYKPNVLGYVPHDKQKIFHELDNRFKLYIGGNRSGKTTSGIVEDIDWMAGTNRYRRTPDPPVAGRIIGVDFMEGIEQILKPQFKRWCPPSYLRGGSWYSAYDSDTRTVNFENGSTAEFMSYEQDVEKFAGTSRNFIHFDEEPPQDIYIECIARLVDTEGSWWMTLTPVMGMQWMYDDIYIPGKEGRDPDVAVIEVEMWENPYLTEVGINTFLRALPEEDRKARISGQFTRRGGVIYKHFNARTHVIKPLEEIPEGWELYASMDHGFNNPTSWHWHIVSPDGEAITFAEHYEREMTIPEHAQIVLAMEKQIGRIPLMRICDPACAQRNPLTGTSVMQEYAQAGVDMVAGVNDVIVGINKVNSYMKGNPPKWHVTNICPKMIEEIPKYRWKTWANKKSERENNPYDVPHKKNDHAMDDLRYFFTVMPDLAPIAETKKVEPPEPDYDVISRRPVYDTNLRKDKWKIESPDEYMGGEW